jgi:hypothetical protein
MASALRRGAIGVLGEAGRAHSVSRDRVEGRRGAAFRKE